MQRLLSVKILSDPTRLFGSSSSPSSASSFLLRAARRPGSSAAFSSSFAGPTQSQLGKLANRNLDHGFLSNPLAIARRKLKMSAWLPTAKLSFRSFDQRVRPRSSFDSYASGWKSQVKRLSPDNAVLGLILANVAVFMLWQVADRGFMIRNFMISLDNIRSGYLHTIVTSAFSHVSAGHLVSNMLGVYFFGQHIGRTFGPGYLLKLYFAGAIGGSIFYLAYHYYLASQSKNRGTFAMDPSRIPGLGASGAVNAIMLLDIFLYPKATLMLDFIIPVPAILLGIYIIGKDMLRVIQGDTQVSGSAHLGGATVAAIAWARARRLRF